MQIRVTIAIFTVLFLTIYTAHAQTPFSTVDSVDINNIKATVLVHGDLWRNLGSAVSGCEFPKGSHKDISFAGSLWMAGYDGNSLLHVAAQTYRDAGNDYWPGPLNGTDSTTYSTSAMWAKIWKVNRTQVDSFLSLTTHTTANTPAVILQWPAKGNTHAAGNGGVALTINEDMAPFVDVDQDGIYNALQGDYPAIKGDQALWWVFNDNGTKHNQTNGLPLNVEVHAMAYAYKRGTIIDNVIYYEYNVINKSSVSYTNFRIGQWNDADIGASFDDYVGFDSTHRMGIAYNGNPTDAVYGDSLPTVGLTLLSLPGDAPGSYVPAGSFMYHNSTMSIINGDPTEMEQYDDLLRARWEDGSHLKDDYIGPGHPSTGYTQFAPDCNYVYPGDPADGNQWSECASANPPNDRRYILASNDFTFTAGSSQKFAVALLATNPTLNNGCPSTSFTAIKNLADTVWAFYQNVLPAQGVVNVQQLNTIHIYPNPTHDRLFIDNGNTTGTVLAVYNMLGQVVQVPVNNNQSMITLDVSALPSGVYNILYNKQGVQSTARFVKD